MRYSKFPKRNLVKYLAVGIFVITFLVVANVARVPTTSASTPNGLLVLTLNIVNQNPKLPSTNYVAELFDYSSAGQTTIAPVAVQQLNAGDSVSLYDNSINLQSLTPLTPAHYSLLVTQQLSNGSVLILLNYDWSSSSTKPNTIQLIVLRDYKVRFIMDGSVVPFIVRTPYNQTISAPANSTTVTIQTLNETYTDEWPITTLSNSQTPNSPSLTAATAQTPTVALPVYRWVKVASWTDLYTTIGEATGSGYMSDVFTYGESAGSKLDVVTSANGGGWQVSGSVTIYSASSASVTWPVLHCCSNYLANTYFNYEEDQLEQCYIGCVPLKEYKLYATGWQGGDEPWDDAGLSYSPPGDCLPLSTIEQNYNYAPYGAGSHTNFVVANGYRYSVAVTISTDIVGTTVAAQIGDTTEYNQHVIQNITFGTQYSYYYLYTNGNNYTSYLDWPILFSSNTAANCGP